MAKRKSASGKAREKTPAKRKTAGRKKSGRRKAASRKHAGFLSRTVGEWTQRAGEKLSALRERLWCMDEEKEVQNVTPAKKRAKKAGAAGKERTTMDEDESRETSAPEAAPPDSGDQDISWNQQLSSIIFGILALFMMTLILFKGDNFWTVMHNFIFGLLGNMAVCWNALLVYSGYMFAKQKGALRILEITRAAAGMIVFVDVLNYILIQSNGYRNVFNEPSYTVWQMVGKIYEDGSRPGGTGLIGGIIGEILLRLLGKMGGAIVCVLALFGLSMLISHTTPVALIESIRTSLQNAWNVTTAMFREELPQRIHAVLNGEEEERVSFDGDDMYDDEDLPPEPDDIFVITDESDGSEPTVTVPLDEEEQRQEAEEMKKSLADMNVDDIIKKVAQIKEKKKKKKTKAEEIQEESQAIAEQMETYQKEQSEASDASDAADTEEPAYQYPTLRLLVTPKNSGEADSQAEHDETADKLILTLEEYGVKASLSHISSGPTVTRYEIKPAPGVKINKITNLSNDIALRLAAQSIRIEAPIPGKPAVGIEIPNKNKQMVRIREIIGSREFMQAKGSLVVALGKDIEGNIVLCDLSKMPHLLIAGSTGSGKSVCVNSMLISLLYKYSPKEVRMVLIDPKSVEFDMYNGIPHLLVPVVCEPKKAAGALQWAVSEMLKRYGMLKERGARNIDNYNRLAEETGEFDKLCRIVIVIDEMADLMIASPKEVEDAIARLAAMARAAGMYMVLATQRPSVDVITGTIKNNIPSRIALAVSSQIDSRTILDEGGAENLIGYGDMLYHPMGSSKHLRVQGCFVEDVEVERVIRYVKRNGAADYDDSIADEIERNSMDGSMEAAADFSDKDEFFEKAVEVVTEAGQASTSMLQRRLGVGYARAGRIIDQLEEQGIIGPYEGSKPRAVLITHAQWLERTMSKIPSGKNDPIVRSHSQFAAQTLDNGHEEITARQAEFFNADEAEDEYFEEDFPIEDDEAPLLTEPNEEIGEEAEDTLPEEIDTPQDILDEDDDLSLIPSREEETVDMEDEVTFLPELPEEPSDAAHETPRVRDFTDLFADPFSHEEETAEAEEAFQPKLSEEPSNAAHEAPRVRDFTDLFADPPSHEEETEEAEETFLPELPDEPSDAAHETPRVRDFTDLFADPPSHEEEAIGVEETFLPELPDEPSDAAHETPRVRDFTQFFDDDEPAPLPAKSKVNEPATSTGRDFTQFFDSDDEPPSFADLDLPPWEDLPAAGQERRDADTPASRLFDDGKDEDELYGEILSSHWVSRLPDDNK